MPSYGSLKDRREKELIFTHISNVRTTTTRPTNESGNSLFSAARSPALQKVAIITVMLFIASIFATIKHHVAVIKEEQSSIERVYFKKLDEQAKAQIFEAFLLKYDKYYADPDEYDERYRIFKENLDLCDERNSADQLAGGSAVHGITMFTDITSQEFSKKYLMSFASEGVYSSIATPTIELPSSYADESRDFVDGVLSEVAVDWTEGYTSEVVNQGSTCGSGSWAFAAAAQIESDAVRLGLLGLDSFNVLTEAALSFNTYYSGTSSRSRRSSTSSHSSSSSISNDGSSNLAGMIISIQPLLACITHSNIYGDDSSSDSTSNGCSVAVTVEDVYSYLTALSSSEATSTNTLTRENSPLQYAAAVPYDSIQIAAGEYTGVCASVLDSRTGSTTTNNSDDNNGDDDANNDDKNNDDGNSSGDGNDNSDNNNNNDDDDDDEDDDESNDDDVDLATVCILGLSGWGSLSGARFSTANAAGISYKGGSTSSDRHTRSSFRSERRIRLDNIEGGGKAITSSVINSNVNDRRKSEALTSSRTTDYGDVGIYPSIKAQASLIDIIASTMTNVHAEAHEEIGVNKVKEVVEKAEEVVGIDAADKPVSDDSIFIDDNVVDVDIDVEDMSVAVEMSMLKYLLSTGTLSACLDASSWNTYISGVVSVCDLTSINHCVQIVGATYDPLSKQGYFKVRNSWGSDWGENGYIYLKYGSNLCGITYNPSYTQPAAVPVSTTSSSTPSFTSSLSTSSSTPAHHSTATKSRVSDVSKRRDRSDDNETIEARRREQNKLKSNKISDIHNIQKSPRNAGESGAIILPCQ